MLMRVYNLHICLTRAETLTASSPSCQSVAMKNLVHVGPPLASGARFQGLLHWHHKSPPFLRLWISRHCRHVRSVVRAVIFEISEQEVVFQIDGIVSNIATPDHGEHFWPHRRVIFLVGFKRLRPYFDYRTIALHVIVLSRSGCGSSVKPGLTMRVTRCTPEGRSTIFDAFGSWLYLVRTEATRPRNN